MKICNIDSNLCFQARFANDKITKNVLTAVKKDYFCNPYMSSTDPIVNLLNIYKKVCKGDAYRLSTENDKLIMTSVIPSKYRNTEQITYSLSESFMRLIGKFINLKSV